MFHLVGSMRSCSGNVPFPPTQRCGWHGFSRRLIDFGLTCKTATIWKCSAIDLQGGWLGRSRFFGAPAEFDLHKLLNPCPLHSTFFSPSPLAQSIPTFTDISSSISEPAFMTACG